MNKITGPGQQTGLHNETLFHTLIEDATTPAGLYAGRELRVLLVNNFFL